MKTKSIRYYYFTSLTAVLVVGVLVMGIIQATLAASYFSEEKEKPLRQVVATVVGGFQLDQITLQDYSSLRALDYMASTSGTIIFVTGPLGVVRFSTGPGAPSLGVQVTPDILQTLAETGTYTDQTRLGGLYTVAHYTHAAPLFNSTGSLEGFVFASSDASDMRAYLSDTISAFILSAACVLLVSSVIALVLSNRIVAPLRRVADAAHRFGEGDYSARVPVQGGDELARLAVTFNEMAHSFQATDASRRSFMGNIAHELRTPMTTIKGFIDGMRDGTIPLDQRDKYLAIVSDEVGRLARLTKNMLDISRLEAGEYTPNITVFDIWGPLVSVFLGAEQRLEEKRLSVEGLDEQAPVLVRADADFVHQVLFNLVDNAIKFANEGGTVSASVHAGKAVVTIAVRNTGAGMSPETRAHVFDRFYKEDQSRGVNARGAGLGLHISRVLVNLMGGRIWAESEEDAWSEFRFTLPIAPAKKTRPKGRPHAQIDNDDNTSQE